MVYSGLFWFILVYSGLFWFILVHSGSGHMDSKAKEGKVKTATAHGKRRPTKEPSQPQSNPTTDTNRKAELMSTINWQEDDQHNVEAKESLIESDDEFGDFGAERVKAHQDPRENGKKAENGNANFFAVFETKGEQTSQVEAEPLFDARFSPVNSNQSSDNVDLLNIGGGSQPQEDILAGRPSNDNIDLMDAGPRDPSNLDLLVNPSSAESLLAGSSKKDFSSDAFDPFQQQTKTPNVNATQSPHKNQTKTAPSRQEDFFDPFAASSGRQSPAADTKTIPQKNVLFNIGDASNDAQFDPFRALDSGTTSSPAHLSPPAAGLQNTSKMAHSSDNLLCDFGSFSSGATLSSPEKSKPTLKQVDANKLYCNQQHNRINILKIWHCNS